MNSVLYSLLLSSLSVFYITYYKHLIVICQQFSTSLISCYNFNQGRTSQEYPIVMHRLIQWSWYPHRKGWWYTFPTGRGSLLLSLRHLSVLCNMEPLSLWGFIVELDAGAAALRLSQNRVWLIKVRGLSAKFGRLVFTMFIVGIHRQVRSHRPCHWLWGLDCLQARFHPQQLFRLQRTTGEITKVHKL